MADQVDDIFYKRLEAHKLSESDLRRFNYPRTKGTQKGKAQLCNLTSTLSYYAIAPGPNKRICKRCNSTFRTNSDGRPAVTSQCVYHVKRLSKGYRPFFPCCRGTKSSNPCKKAPQHVAHDIEPNNLDGFIYTEQNKIPEPGIYALDCEMVFTTTGMDVAAISVVDSKCKLVYDTLVLPNDPIVDYNTEHSELTKEDFKEVTTKLEDIHAKLLTLFGNRTILVGHGLENDLLRLKVIHDHVIDTSILYPHPKGLPFRRALTYLKDEVLRYNNKPVSGRKCRGDAEACMKLARLKCGQSI